MKDIDRFNLGDNVFYTNGSNIEEGIVWGKHFGDHYTSTSNIVTYVMKDGSRINCHCVFSSKEKAKQALLDSITEQ